MFQGMFLPPQHCSRVITALSCVDRCLPVREGDNSSGRLQRKASLAIGPAWSPKACGDRWRAGQVVETGGAVPGSPPLG